MLLLQSPRGWPFVVDVGGIKTWLPNVWGTWCQGGSSLHLEYLVALEREGMWWSVALSSLLGESAPGRRWLVPCNAPWKRGPLCEESFRQWVSHGLLGPPVLFWRRTAGVIPGSKSKASLRPPPNPISSSVASTVSWEMRGRKQNFLSTFTHFIEIKFT